MKINDGGPAFPRDSENLYYEGMSLRDWFAGQALFKHYIEPSVRINEKDIAEQCYKQADAMLKEREKEK